MRKIVIALAAAGVAGAGLTAYAANMPRLDQLSAGSAGLSGHILPVKTDVYDYCIKVMSDMKRGGKYGASPDFAAMDCVGLFATAAEPGQPGRGGDGGSLPGLPGGKGGAAGNAGGAGGSGGSTTRPPVDSALLDYCAEVLKQKRPGAAKGKAAASDEYEAEDCADYFASLDATGSASRSGRDGADGASIAGGQGGKGGKAGSGSGGGAGGGGGVGVGGGKGGKGGAGGSTD